ncbi:MAG: tRNA (adenosine(37)-N6)-threonylcarbamoyltransferase complex transferase subunit TsaD [Acidobacteriota bacterium]|nr:tRNA (adenosine(37)-N6)-threonylcarbamoyltransferase complex transferase subunit TsaD [Acidobacteriota bacterium]
MLVLGIESSCDETAAALVQDGHRVLSSVVASQVATHRAFGGVVPELASREHLRNIGYVVSQAFKEAGKAQEDIDGIAVTQGPGLVGSLLVGVSFAKAMAFATGKPLVPVNHVEGHIFSAFVENPGIEYPLLALTVSGGHSSLIHAPGPGRYEVVGRTRDDAAGEALDKVSKFLGLGYPGGPVIDRLAKGGDAGRFAFSIPKISDGRLDFSFSGFKTAALRHIQAAGIKPQRGGRVSQVVLDLVASYQRAIVDTLIRQTRKAAERLRPRSMLLVGGVACNSLLRDSFRRTFETGREASPCGLSGDKSLARGLLDDRTLTRGLSGDKSLARGLLDDRTLTRPSLDDGAEVRVYIPSPAYTTDNGVMIAAAGTPRLLAARGLPLDLGMNADPGLVLC